MSYQVEIDTINIITPRTCLNGSVSFSNDVRFEGTLKGELKGMPGSQIILGESSVVEGEIYCDQLIIDGYVRGKIHATGKVHIGSHGRVIGEIISSNIQIDFGGLFEGTSKRC